MTFSVRYGLINHVKADRSATLCAVFFFTVLSSGNIVDGEGLLFFFLKGNTIKGVQREGKMNHCKHNIFLFKEHMATRYVSKMQRQKSELSFSECIYRIFSYF